MKKGLLFTAFALLFSIAMQAQITTLACGTVVDQGCVGACGSPDALNFTVPLTTTTPHPAICLEVTDYSLCGSHIAGAWIYINGELRKRVKLHPGMSGSFRASPGDEITVKMDIKYVNPGIFCVWLGEVHLEMSF